MHREPRGWAAEQRGEQGLAPFRAHFFLFFFFLGSWESLACVWESERKDGWIGGLVHGQMTVLCACAEPGTFSAVALHSIALRTSSVWFCVGTVCRLGHEREEWITIYEWVKYFCFAFPVCFHMSCDVLRLCACQAPCHQKFRAQDLERPAD